MAQKKGFKHSEETKKKMSISRKGSVPWNKGIKGKANSFYGKQHSEETKVKMSVAAKGRKNTKEHKQNISKSCLGKKRPGWKSPTTFSKKMWKDRDFRDKILPRKYSVKNTSIEVKIQNFLKQLGIEYFTHQYIKIEHGYQCDVLIPSMNLVIECDGDYWHNYPVGNDIDHVRTSELIEKGFKVLRLWEFEIRAMNINEFKEKIL